MIFLRLVPIVTDFGFSELAATVPVCQPSGKPPTRFPLEGPVEQEPNLIFSVTFLEILFLILDFSISKSHFFEKLKPI